jgi:hypothetical protein
MGPPNVRSGTKRGPAHHEIAERAGIYLFKASAALRHPSGAGAPGGKSFTSTFVRPMNCLDHILAIDAKIVKTEFVELEKLCKRRLSGSVIAHFTKKTQQARHGIKRTSDRSGPLAEKRKGH